MSEKNLAQNKTDLFVSSAKSILGAVPVVGSLLTELVGNLIPNQRIDRLSKYVNELELKLSSITQEKIQDALKSEECIDLFEEGFIQASRAQSDERRKHIANVVGNGIDDESIEYAESKYILKLLQDLNDQEIIWLRFYLFPTIGGDEEFRNRYKNVLNRVPASMGSDVRTIERAALQDSYTEHLERLGLIRPYYRLDRELGIPEFDKFSGKPSVTHRAITALGKLILKQIDFLDE